MAELSDLIGLVMQNPALVQGALSALGTMSSQGQAQSTHTGPIAPQENEREERTEQTRPEQNTLLARRRALLQGVRPYLGERTCRRMDAALALLSVMESVGEYSGPKGEENGDVSESDGSGL